jgi:ribosomal protein L12E/L44/L45/RPP1/RPP2
MEAGESPLSRACAWLSRGLTGALELLHVDGSTPVGIDGIVHFIDLAVARLDLEVIAQHLPQFDALEGAVAAARAHEGGREKKRGREREREEGRERERERERKRERARAAGSKDWCMCERRTRGMRHIEATRWSQAHEAAHVVYAH